MEIEPLHAFLGSLAVVMGGIALIWVYSSLKDKKEVKFSAFLGHFILGVFALLLSNLTHISRELFDFSGLLGDFVKLPEFGFLIAGYLILILGVKRIGSSFQKYAEDA